MCYSYYQLMNYFCLKKYAQQSPTTPDTSPVPTNSYITYGTSLLLAKAYHEGDIDMMRFVQEGSNIADIVASTNQLLLLLLQSIPQGALSHDRSIDLRLPAMVSFMESNVNQPRRIAGYTKKISNSQTKLSLHLL